MTLALRRHAAPRRLTTDRAGIAMTEFALSLLFLLPIAMTGIEVANLAVTTLRLNQLAMLAADNVARYRGAIDEAQVDEVMTGIAFAGQNIGFGRQGRAIVSSVESNGRTGTLAGYRITWQRCVGAKDVASSYGVAGDGSANAGMAAGMGPAGGKVKPVTGAALIFAELRYTYRPVVGMGFLPPIEMSSLQSFTVRDRASETLTNTGNMSEAKKRLCDRNHLSAA